MEATFVQLSLRKVFSIPVKKKKCRHGKEVGKIKGERTKRG